MQAAFWKLLIFAADAANAPAADKGAAPAQAPGSMISLLFPLVLIFLLFYFLIMRPERRKQSDHKRLLEAIKKNDRVVTIGGIYGVVANVEREDDRVTIKVDETNNIKLDVTFGAIARVLTDAEADTK